MYDIETVVVGAGVVGLATASALARTGREVVVLEKNKHFGSEISSRNSEVVHAGIYYSPGSLKAKLCVEGRELLYQYCAERGVFCNAIGKLIVATDENEKEKLADIARHAQSNGVHDLRELSIAEAQALEPHLSCRGALHSPSTGIVDSHSLMLCLLADFERDGGILVCNTPLKSANTIANGFKLHLEDSESTAIRCKELVISAGLHAVQLCQRIRGWQPTRYPTAKYAKGSYFGFSGRVPFQRLIYPVPVEGGLGVHLTLDQSGAGRFGPDVEWLRTRNVSPNDFDYRVDPNRATAFYAAIRQYWPDLPDNSLVPDYAGVRPKISYSDKMSGDFVIQSERDHHIPGLVNLLGIESPGLTSSLAIANYVTEALI